MIQRCTNQKSSAFKDYGGRGITVCERWKTFANFLADMGDKPVGLTLERIDNNKGYHKDNCRWATRKEQMRNRRGNIIVEFRGVKGCLKAVCEQFGANAKNVGHRLLQGWSVEEAFLLPKHAKPRRRRAGQS